MTNPPKAIDWTMIPGIRKSTYSKPGVWIAPPKTNTNSSTNITGWTV